MPEKNLRKNNHTELRRWAEVRFREGAGEERSLGTEEDPLKPEGERIPHLLLAEDDPNNRKALGLLLQWAKYHLDFAEDGLKAVEMWEKGEYDLVLMDIQMPHLDGFAATRAIRAKERERGGYTPIIALTAHSSKEDEERCLANGMDAFISKPIDINNCKVLIEQILQQKSCGSTDRNKQERTGCF